MHAGRVCHAIQNALIHADVTGAKKDGRLSKAVLQAALHAYMLMRHS